MIRRGEYGKRAIAAKETYLLTILLSVLCWAVGYVGNLGFPMVEDAYDTPLWHKLCHIIPNKETAYGIGLLLMFGAAFLIQRMNYVVGLIREKTVLPFLFFVLFVSTNPDFFPLKPTSLGVFCLVLGVYELFLSYHNSETQVSAFNWALLIGIGSLFWVHIVWFVPLYWFGMYHLRSLGFRTFLASLLGFLTVYWFVLGWCVWQKDFTLFTASFPLLVQFKLMVITGSIWSWLTVCYSVLLTLIAAINILTQEYSDSLRTRENLSFLVIFSVWAILLYFLYDYASEEFLVTACIPMSILVAHFFTVRWNKWVRVLFYFTIVFFITVLFIRVWNNL